MDEKKIVEELQGLKKSFQDLSKAILFQAEQKSKNTQGNNPPSPNGFPFIYKDKVFLAPPGEHGYCSSCLKKRGLGIPKSKDSFSSTSSTCNTCYSETYSYRETDSL